MDAPQIWTPLELDEIRVLTLLGGADSDPVHCTLAKRSVEGPELGYVALSWSWGPQTQVSEKITVDGVVMEIRPTLHDALLALREQSEGQDVTLWIDAICINQQDNEEKSRQIPLMSEIYTKADCVVIWLGTAADDSEFAFDCLRGGDSSSLEGFRSISALMKILERSWFSRTWILQEFALNKNMPQIACGHGQWVAWNVFADAVTASLERQTRHGKGTIPLPSQSAILSVRALDQLRQDAVQGRALTLRGALRRSKVFKATDARDKVWGILGLVSTAIRVQFLDQFPVDYSRKTTSEVFRDVSVFLLAYEGTSTLYGEYSREHDNSLQLPSWVADLTSPHSHPMRTNAGGKLDSARIRTEDNCLNVYGVVLDEVTEVDECKTSVASLFRGNRTPISSYPMLALTFLVIFMIQPSNKAERNNVKRRTAALFLAQRVLAVQRHNKNCIKIVQRLALRMSSRYTENTNGAKPPEDLWTTLLGGFTEEEFLQDNAKCQEWFDAILATNTSLFSIDTNPEANKLLNHICTRLSERAFFTCQGQWYGVSQLGMKKGDLLAFLFPDTFHPFIIRRKRENFELVGVAFVPKQMRQEFLETRTNELRMLTIV